MDRLRLFLKITLLLMITFLCPAVDVWARLDSLVYDTRKDWIDNWTFPKGTLQIGEDGWIRPVYIRKNVNACVDAGQFVVEKDASGNPVRWGGILGAGSNLSRAKNILDGDVRTSWSPNPNDDVKKWWVEIDLGRVVTATKVVLKFGPGKPFEQFEVYVSNGKEALFPGSKVKDYKLVGRTTQPNSNDVLEYPLEKEMVRGEEVPRHMVRYVYLVLTSHPEDPGQLAELQVYSLGDNVMLGALDRFGYLVVGVEYKEGSAIKVADGDYTSAEEVHAVIFAWRQRGWIRVDLGSLFWLDTIRTIGVASVETLPMVGYKLFVSDGTILPGTTTDPVMRDFVWQEVGSLEKNPPPGEKVARYIFEDTFSPRPVRYIFFSNRNNETDRGPAVREEIAEMQAFGEGYVPGATLTSQLINMGTSRNLTSIGWKASTPPGTGIEIRTRTGDQIEEVVLYYCRDGKECDKRKWDREVGLFGSSGPRIVEQRPDTTWSGWSRPYLHSGERFASPSPRKYLLIEAKLSSKDPQITPSLDSITLFSTDPVAKGLAGYVFPSTARASTPTTFSYFLQPSFASGDGGFDEILIQTPSPPRLLWVTIGETQYTPDQLSAVQTTADSLWIRLPVRIRTQREPVIEVRFQCVVFDDNTVFDAFVGDSRSQGSYQRVDPIIENATTVTLSLTEEVIEDVSIQPEVMTPNGDGVNDAASIDFTVLKLSEPRPVHVRIHNVQGKVIRELKTWELSGRSGLSGRYRALWDGRDRSGEGVLPGVYLCRITVDTEKGEAAVTRTIVVIF
jgi:hypothetical protein